MRGLKSEAKGSCLLDCLLADDENRELRGESQGLIIPKSQPPKTARECSYRRPGPSHRRGAERARQLLQASTPRSLENVVRVDSTICCAAALCNGGVRARGEVWVVNSASLSWMDPSFFFFSLTHSHRQNTGFSPLEQVKRERKEKRLGLNT